MPVKRIATRVHIPSTNRLPGTAAADFDSDAPAYAPSASGSRRRKRIPGKPKEKRGKRIKNALEDIDQFTMLARMLGFLVKDGYAPAVAVELLGKQASGSMAMALREAVKGIKSGQSLSVSFRNTGFFPEEFCSTLAAGEKNGQIPGSMDSYVTYLENIVTMNRSMKSALRYPSFMLSFMAVMGTFLLIFVTPKLQEMCTSMNVPVYKLPLVTRALFKVYSIATVMTQWPLVVAAIVFAYYMFFGKGKDHMIKLLAVLPQIKSIHYRLAWSQWLLLGAACLKSGMRLIEMLQTVKNTPPPEMLDPADYGDVLRNVNGGQSLSAELARLDAPIHVAQSIGIAEHSGRVGEAMESIARQYLYSLSYDTKAVGAIMEPVVIAVATFVGGGIAGIFIMTVLAISGSVGG
jgi:MSHA biogenesis protein MshG